MFDFRLRTRANQIKRFMQSRMNRHYVRQVRAGDRRATRGAFCEVVWMVAFDSADRPEFGRATPALTRDISADGLSILHHEPVDEGRPLLIGLHNGDESSFVRCRIEHVTPLGFGYRQLGLRPEEIVEFDPPELHAFRRRVETVRREQGPGLPRMSG
ncbi:MAG: hypothetical protein WD066_13110 [Planctomycetaceae bacterium]